MAKAPKQYVITCTRGRTGQKYVSEPLTLEAAVQYYSYTLECGESWQHERGNKKINRNPKSIAALITNLNNAVNNSAANGYADKTYSYVEFVAVEEAVCQA